MNLRDAIRSAVLSSPRSFRKKTLTVFGEQIEVREPTVGSRAEITKRAIHIERVVDNGDADLSTTIDQLKWNLYAIIFCCYVPGTDEHVFEDTDFDALSGRPVGDLVELEDTVRELMNIEKDAEKKSSRQTVSTV
jgi:hypothetical protein